MGLLGRAFDRARPRGRRPDADDVTLAVAAAVGAVPGVTGSDLLFNHQQYRGGALSGTVDVPDATTFLAALRAAHAVLQEKLGDDQDRVTYYLAGRLPDDERVVPGDVGLTQPPLGRELSSALLE